MKQKLLKTMRGLLVAAGLCVGGTSAWADETVTEVTTVGAEDNSTAWFTAFSKSYTLGANQTLSISFKNYSSKSENWHNWVAYVTSDADRGSCNEYIALRADNSGWGTRWVASNLSSNYKWETFKEDMDGSTVDMTVTRNGALVTIHADITTTGSKTYYENYYTVCGSGTQNLRFFLTVEKAHLTDITSTITDNGNTSDSENWGIENAHIDFTNDITGNNKKSIAGETNSMALGAGSRWVKGHNNIEALSNIIRIGSVDGTITIPDEQLAGSKDEVVISFDIWFGALSGKNAGFYLWDNSATPIKIGGFSSCFFNTTTATEDAFGLDCSKITRIGSSSAQDDAICVNSNKTTFNIHLNYLTGKMYIVQYTNGEWQQTTTPVDMGSTNPLKKFVLTSNYTTDSRKCWLDNVFIYTKKGDYNTTANITLTFKDNEENDISALYTGTTAFTPEKGSTFTPSDYYPTVMYDDDYKYTYTSGGDPFEVSGDAVVTLVYTKSTRPTYTYNVTANYGSNNKTIVDEVVKEASDYTYYYPRYILDGTTLYEYASSTDANASASYWTSTHTNVAAAANYTLTYNAIEGECVYFSEGEAVTGAVEYTAFKRYMSGGSSAVFASATKLTTLGAGIYKATMRSLGRTSGDRHTYLYKNSDEEENLIIHKVVSSNSGTDDSALFSLDASTDILAKGGYSTSSENGAGIDYVYIMKLPDNVSVTLGTNGYATFACPYALDLANLPTGLTAYKAAVSGTTVTFSEVTEAVKANTGLLLQGDASQTYSIPVAASGSDISASNAFLVNDGGTTFTADGDYYYFGLIKNTLTFGLFDPTSVAIPADKAYLKVLKSSIDASSRSLTVSFGEDATGINTVKGESNVANSYYNLNGQRVSKPANGLYIVNGKKVIIK
jgi:hypothetical protein